MRRFWIGIILMVLLLCVGLWTAQAMDAVHQPISALLEQAKDAALREDWEQAGALAMSAKAQWENSWRFTAAVADHTPMDDLDSLFAQLPVYLAQRETTHFASTCAELSMLARAMGDAHSLNWWNLL